MPRDVRLLAGPALRAVAGADSASAFFFYGMIFLKPLLTLFLNLSRLDTDSFEFSSVDSTAASGSAEPDRPVELACVGNSLNPGRPCNGSSSIDVLPAAGLTAWSDFALSEAS